MRVGERHRGNQVRLLAGTSTGKHLHLPHNTHLKQQQVPAGGRRLRLQRAALLLRSPQLRLQAAHALLGHGGVHLHRQHLHHRSLHLLPQRGVLLPGPVGGGRQRVIAGQEAAAGLGRVRCRLVETGGGFPWPMAAILVSPPQSNQPRVPPNRCSQPTHPLQRCAARPLLPKLLQQVLAGQQRRLPLPALLHRLCREDNLRRGGGRGGQRTRARLACMFSCRSQWTVLTAEGRPRLCPKHQPT